MVPALAFLLAASLSAAPRFSLTLAEAEAAARAYSLRVKASLQESAAAKDRAEEQFASLLPRLTLEGYYRYATEVPSLALLPGQPARPFGDHRATSLGPALSWTLWDQGALYKAWRAQKALAASQDEQGRLEENRALLGARLAYVQVQLAGEQIRQLADSLALAEAQYRDIENRFKAGTASRIDKLSAHQDSLHRRKQFLQAQSELSASLRELLQLIGRGRDFDLLSPFDARISTASFSGLGEPSLLVELEGLDAPQPALAAAESALLDARHPSLMAYALQAEALRLAASGLSANRGPAIRLRAQASRDYPNGPVLESVTQKSVGLTASLPLFEGGSTRRAVDEKRRQAAAADYRRELALDELARDWEKARAALFSLRAQQVVDDRSVAETEELARLVYLSYQAGRSSYLEVQSSNLRALEAKVQAARTRAQALIQLATLAGLAAQG